MPDRLASPRLRTVAIAMSLSGALLLGACATDDGATVREIGTEDGSSASSSGSASGSGSASAPASGSGSASGTAVDGTAPEVEQVDGDGGYTYASDVSAHRLVVRDVCVINELRSADPIDYDAIREIYTDDLLGWQIHVQPTVTAIDVPGGHSSALQEPCVGVLAKHMQRCLRSVLIRHAKENSLPSNDRQS